MLWIWLWVWWCVAMELAGAARDRELVELDLPVKVEGHSDLVLLGTLVGWRHGVVITAWCVRAATATKRARATCVDGWRVGNVACAEVLACRW